MTWFASCRQQDSNLVVAYLLIKLGVQVCLLLEHVCWVNSCLGRFFLLLLFQLAATSLLSFLFRFLFLLFQGFLAGQGFCKASVVNARSKQQQAYCQSYLYQQASTQPAAQAWCLPSERPSPAAGCLSSHRRPAARSANPQREHHHALQQSNVQTPVR